MNNEVLILKKDLHAPDYKLLYPLMLATILLVLGLFDWDSHSGDAIQHSFLLLGLLTAIVAISYILVRGILNRKKYVAAQYLLGNRLTNKYGIPFTAQEIECITRSEYHYIYISYLQRAVLVTKTYHKSGFYSFVLEEYNGQVLNVA